MRDENEQVLRASKLKKQVERFPNHPTHYVNIVYTCFRIKNRKIHVKGEKNMFIRKKQNMTEIKTKKTYLGNNMS